MMRHLTLDRIGRGLAHPMKTANRLGHDIAARLAFRFTDGLSPSPELVVIALGNRCNLRCKMCPQWGERGTSKALSAEDARRELTLDTLRPFIAELATIKPAVHLTGGETLLASESMEIISLLKSHGLTVSLTTNGTLLADKADQLVELGVDEIVVSVDGTEAAHDSIRGVPGTFSRMIGGIEAIDAARRARKTTRPRITTQTTLSADNLDCLVELVEYLASSPVDVIGIHHLEFCTPDVLEGQHRTFSSEFGIESDSSWFGLPQESGIDPLVLVERLEAVRALRLGSSRLKVIPDFDTAEIVSYYGDGGYLPKRLADRCLFPWKGLILYPDGSIIGCPNYCVGDIKTDSLRAVWNGQAYRRLRSVLKNRKVFPVCSRCCWLYYHST